MKILTTFAGAWIVVAALSLVCFALLGVMFKVMYMGFMFGWSLL
jgi:hypothetical protein